MSDDQEQLLKWRAESDSAKHLDAARKAEARGKNDALLPLEPLQRLYHKLPYDQRLAMEITVINYLRKQPR